MTISRIRSNRFSTIDKMTETGNKKSEEKRYIILHSKPILNWHLITDVFSDDDTVIQNFITDVAATAYDMNITEIEVPTLMSSKPMLTDETLLILYKQAVVNCTKLIICVLKNPNMAERMLITIDNLPTTRIWTEATFRQLARNDITSQQTNNQSQNLKHLVCDINEVMGGFGTSVYGGRIRNLTNADASFAIVIRDYEHQKHNTPSQATDNFSVISYVTTLHTKKFKLQARSSLTEKANCSKQLENSIQACMDLLNLGETNDDTQEIIVYLCTPGRAVQNDEVKTIITTISKYGIGENKSQRPKVAVVIVQKLMGEEVSNWKLSQKLRGDKTTPTTSALLSDEVLLEGKDIENPEGALYKVVFQEMFITASKVEHQIAKTKFRDPEPDMDLIPAHLWLAEKATEYSMKKLREQLETKPESTIDYLNKKCSI